MADTVPTAPQTKTAEPPVVVKKYANRRLYDTRSSSYITLDNLAEMVRQGRDFVVYDAKSGEDITRGVLTQIIVEEEGKGRSLLPTAFLRQLIGFYGDQMQGLVPKYLEQALAAFGQQQEQMRAAMQKTMGSVGTLFPFGNMEEVSRQNMAMMERAFSLFTPFYRPTGEMPAGRSPGGEPADEVSSLQAEVERLRRELAEATANKDLAVAKANKELAEAKASKELAEAKASKELAEAKASKELAEARANKELAEARANKELAEANASKELAEARASKELAEAKASNELVEAKPTKK